jgi:hypothetical protein
MKLKADVLIVGGVVLAGLLAWLVFRSEPAGTPVAPPKTAPLQPASSAQELSAPLPGSAPPVDPSQPPPKPAKSSAIASRPQPPMQAPALAPQIVAPGPPASVAPVFTPAAATAEDIEGAMRDMDKVALTIRDYRTLMKENPVGTNSEIMRALLGENAKGARLAPAEAQLNGKGELVDRWGTPYFFHQMSRTEMEIHSAGPDRRMGTSDDIIQH